MFFNKITQFKKNKMKINERLMSFTKLYLLHIHLRYVLRFHSIANIHMFTCTHTLTIACSYIEHQLRVKKTKVNFINFGRLLLCHFPISCHKICTKLYSLMQSTKLQFCLSIALEIEIIKTVNLSYNQILNYVKQSKWLLCTIVNRFMPSKISEF